MSITSCWSHSRQDGAYSSGAAPEVTPARHPSADGHGPRISVVRTAQFVRAARSSTTAAPAVRFGLYRTSPFADSLPRVTSQLDSLLSATAGRRRRRRLWHLWGGCTFSNIATCHNRLLPARLSGRRSLRGGLTARSESRPTTCTFGHRILISYQILQSKHNKANQPQHTRTDDEVIQPGRESSNVTLGVLKIVVVTSVPMSNLGSQSRLGRRNR